MFCGIFAEARADIAGPQEKYLKPGSTLRLVCRVLQSTEPPLYLFWYHNNRMINYDTHRGVNVSTDAGNVEIMDSPLIEHDYHVENLPSVSFLPSPIHFLSQFEISKCTTMRILLPTGEPEIGRRTPHILMEIDDVSR